MTIPSVSALLAVLGMAQGPSTGAQPVQLWLSRDAGSLRVEVRTATDGYVTILRRGSEGQVEVLFPADPANPAFVPAGTYDLRRPDDEPSATVLVAVSRDPLRVGEFVSGTHWDGAALTQATSAEDAEGALTEIVQRMLGDESFNYDLMTYSGGSLAAVPDDSLIESPPPESCDGCSVTGDSGVVVPEEPLVCDPAFADCFPFVRAHRHRSVTQTVTPTHTLAVYARGRPAATSEARGLATVAEPAPTSRARPQLVAPHRPLVKLPPIVIVQGRHQDDGRVAGRPGSQVMGGASLSGLTTHGAPPPAATQTLGASSGRQVIVVKPLIPAPAPAPASAHAPAQPVPHTIAVPHVEGSGATAVRLVPAHS